MNFTKAQIVKDVWKRFIFGWCCLWHFWLYDFFLLRIWYHIIHNSLCGRKQWRNDLALNDWKAWNEWCHVISRPNNSFIQWITIVANAPTFHDVIYLSIRRFFILFKRSWFVRNFRRLGVYACLCHSWVPAIPIGFLVRVMLCQSLFSESPESKAIITFLLSENVAHLFHRYLIEGM